MTTPSEGVVGATGRWSSGPALAAVLVLTAAALLPFLAKPFFTDDPLFVWSAEQILRDPLRPYACEVNWFGELKPLHATTFSPPLAAYVLALGVWAFGLRETALHAHFLLPVLLAVAGTWCLARRWCARPAVAALVMLAAPAFLVSATSLMADMVLLAAWLWALELWIRGDERGSTALQLAACACALAAALAKHFGLAVLPLCALWTLAARPWSERWLATHAQQARSLEARPRRAWSPGLLLLPVLGLAGVEFWNAHVYGASLLLRAWSTSGDLRATVGQPPYVTGFVLATFLGGSLASVLVLSPAWLGLRRSLAWVAAAIGVGFLLSTTPLDGEHVLHFDPEAAGLVRAQAALWIAGAGLVLELVLTELRERRERASFLLAAWVLGTLVFALFFNWGVNARTLLPLVPAVAILAARRLEQAPAPPAWLVPSALAAALALALLVALGEQELARSQRDAARELVARGRTEGRPVFIQGHWGFQHYAERAGATSLTVAGPPPPPGAAVILPLRNTGVWSLAPESVARAERIVRPLALPLTTFGWSAGASFHAHTMGPLPFALNRGAGDEYAYVVVP